MGPMDPRTQVAMQVIDCAASVGDALFGRESRLERNRVTLSFVGA